MRIFKDCIFLFGLGILMLSKGCMAMTADEKVEKAYVLGMTKYNSLYDFGRDKRITRQEFAKFLSVVLMQQDIQYFYQKGSCDFEDNDKDQSLVYAVQLVCSQGIMKGGGGYFGYTNNLQRGEMISILVRLKSDPMERIALLHAEQGDDWYSLYQVKSKELGMQFQHKHYESFVTRGQALHYILKYVVIDTKIDDNIETQDSITDQDSPIEKVSIEMSPFLGLFDL